jgi:hypothetical protein
MTLHMALGVLGLLLTFPSAAAAHPGWHTRGQAERNIVNAPRALRHWSRALVNPETLVVRPNVSVTCRGLGQVRGRRRFTRFACIVRYHDVRLRLTYTAQTSNGFELHGRRTANHP